MKVIITFTFCCDNLWKSKFVALEKPGNLREFFSPTSWPPCVTVFQHEEVAVAMNSCCIRRNAIDLFKLK